MNDYEFEGMLATARAWAFGETDLYCTMGITEPDENGNYFKVLVCSRTNQFKLLMIRSSSLSSLS